MIEKNKTYLVTGATGIIGKSLCSKIISLGAKVVALSRNKDKLQLLKDKYLNNITIIPGDISQKLSITDSLKNVDGIFHLAALANGSQSGKATESINTNILGTINILKQTLNQNFDFIVGISSDKAVQISGVYGATKFLMEKLFLEYESINPKTNYRIVRLGNILYSSDSVLEKWKKSISKGEQIKISDKTSTRFFISVHEAVDIILESLSYSKNAKPYFREMKSVMLGTLLEAMLLKYSTSKIPIIITGLNINENKHEKISINSLSSKQAQKYNINELKKLI
tara:strand:- start:1896 stop:2744 length:849 start_codon:yes stop_codon:yes gene_type:complete